MVGFNMFQPHLYIFIHIYTKSLAFFFNPELVIQRTRVLAFRAFQIGKTGEDHYMDLNQLRSNTLSESTHHPLRSLCSGSFGDSCCFKTRENVNGFSPFSSPPKQNSLVATRIPWGVCEAKHRLLSGRFHWIPRAGLRSSSVGCWKETARSPPWFLYIFVLQDYDMGANTSYFRLFQGVKGTHIH